MSCRNESGYVECKFSDNGSRNSKLVKIERHEIPEIRNVECDNGREIAKND